MPGLTSTQRYLRIGIASVVFLLGTVSVGIVGYCALKSAGQAAQFEQGLEAFQKGDFAAAELAFGKVLKADPNHEAAFVKLAELNEKRQYWRNAAFYWRWVSGLNPFQSSYEKGAVECSILARDYEKALRMIEALPPERQKNYALILCYATFAAGNTERAQVLFSGLPQDDKMSEKGKYLSFLLTVTPPKRSLADFAEEIVPLLKPFTMSSDSNVALEASLMEATLYTRIGQLAEVEKSLFRASSLNPSCAKVFLGDFYFEIKQFTKACDVYAEALPYGMTPDATVRYAEALFAEKKGDALIVLAEKFPRHEKNLMRKGFYLDAMSAYLKGDYAALGKNLKDMGGAFDSTVATLLRFEYGLICEDSGSVYTALLAASRSSELKMQFDTLSRQSLPFLDSLYRAERVDEAAPLAKLLQPSFPENLLILQIVFLNQTRNGIWDSSALKEALKKYPADPVLLEIATRGALLSGDFQAMQNLAEANLAHGSRSAETWHAAAIALESQGKISEAAEKFEQLVKLYPQDSSVFKKHAAFAVRHQQKETLRKLLDMTRKTSCREIQNLEPFLSAMSDLTDTMKVIVLLTDPRLTETLNVKKVEDAELLYMTACQLATLDAVDASIAIYKKLKPVLPDHLLLMMNLSELYAQKGLKMEALNEAHQAWLSAGKIPMVNLCYGLRLYEAGRYEEAVPVLEPLPQVLDVANAVRALGAWRESVGKMIVHSFNTLEDSACETYCSKLLKADARNRVAKEYLKKLESRSAEASR